MLLNPASMDYEGIYTKSSGWSSTQWGRGRGRDTGVEPMGSNSQYATAGDYVNIIVDEKKPTKSSDVYEHIQ